MKSSRATIGVHSSRRVKEKHDSSGAVSILGYAEQVSSVLFAHEGKTV